MRWRVEWTPTAEAWYRGLDARDQEAIGKSVDQVAAHGPSLGRPTVDRIQGSRHHHMKELRSHGGHLRALFAFDPRRVAIVLVGGDKTGTWQGWYERHIPVADALYSAHVDRLSDERAI
jgi:hypothetical protein